MKTAKQKEQRKDYIKKHNINRNAKDKVIARHKGYIQPYPAKHKFTKPKKKV